MFVPDQAVITRREWGKVDLSLRNALVHITPTASAVYFGIASGARDEQCGQSRSARRGMASR